MKLSIAILIVVFPIIASAQDTVITISPSMFDQRSDQVSLSGVKGWIFKTGNDTAWSKKNIDTEGWEKLKPTELSAKYANGGGKAEGWFRIKIKIDTGFKNTNFYLKGSTWAAIDFYIDGKLVASQGNTGANGMPYQEYNPYGNPALPVDLKPGNEYTISVHFVDYVSPLPPHQLKSEFAGLNSLIRITGPRYNKFYLQNGFRQIVTYYIIWISVCTITSLLLWLLYFQNRNEKNLLLISSCSILIALAVYCQYNIGANTRMSFTGFSIYEFLFNLLTASVSVLVPVILARIFNRSISRGLKYFLIIYFICSVATFFLTQEVGNPIGAGLLAVILGVGIYYISVSWKNLRGAQWAIVAGTLISIAWAIAYIVAGIFQVANSNLYFLLATGYSLSFPLSLLVYAATRFREINYEVKIQAKKVIELSEEKKEQAIQQQKILEEEVKVRTADLRSTLDNLKATQNQLIQSEKMASLGELTAGIAHEIQNPLNFVNNFSEVNTELSDELEQEAEKGNLDEIKTIAKDIKENSEKIKHHGKRADAIVKGMLQHSRASKGLKELTDVNALCDEYLRLSYHGLRAKDSSFNANMKTDYDQTIGTINLVPQDMGRVLLNLYNNAFYAVNQKQKENQKQSGGNYDPTITVSTKKNDRHIEIRVADNGNGIPQNIVDKIFQPFFTTKPTGEGTGLGLSLSYDIVKAHGGELRVETKEGEGTEFIIQWPAS